MVLRSKMTRATTSLTFLTAILALSGCYTPFRTSSRKDAGSPDTSRMDAQSTGGPIDAFTSTGGNGASAGGDAGPSADVNGPGGVGGTAGSLDGPALGGAGGSVEDAPMSTGGIASSGGIPATGGSNSTPGTGGSGTNVTIATGGGPGGIGGGGTGTAGVSTGGQGGVTCTDAATKVCNGTCIPTATCCGGCSGNTPICSNGICVAKTIGDTCSTPAECATSVCADGVCCNVACNGQCESCAMASTKGTCVPVTNPRTPCTSDGTVCGGVCDGTAANRKACVYAGANTLCGQAAQCNSATNQASTAAVCSGGGVCNPATTTSCAPYRCRTDGLPTCATSCPSGQSLCGGTTCVDILGSASHCGGACTACAIATPWCSSGACVQCVTGGNCPSSFGQGAVCSESHVCQCRLPDVGNVVQNPGFDQSTSGWTLLNTLATFDGANDADSCSGSGSIRVTVDPNTANFGSFSQCATVVPDTPYYFGYHYVQAQSNGVECDVRFFSGTTCSGSPLSVSVFQSISYTVGSWLTNQGSLTSPTTAGSATIFCQLGGIGPAWFDQIYLNTVNRF